MDSEYHPLSYERHFFPNLIIKIENIYVDEGSIILSSKQVDLFIIFMIHLERKLCSLLWKESEYIHQRVIMSELLFKMHVYNVPDGIYDINVILSSILFDESSFLFHLCYNIEIV